MAQPSSPSVHGRVEPPRGDKVLTIVLLVSLAPCAFLAASFGLFTGMASDGCFDSQACYDRVGTGTVVNVAAPVLCWVVSTVVAARLIAKRRLSFWVPLVGVVAWVGLLALGLGIAFSEVP